jgi:hypothetical protein
MKKMHLLYCAPLCKCGYDIQVVVTSLLCIQPCRNDKKSEEGIRQPSNIVGNHGR